MFHLYRLAAAVSGRSAAYLALLIATTGSIAVSSYVVLRIGAPGMRDFLAAHQGQMPAQLNVQRRQGSVSLTQDEWHERLRTNSYWSGRSSSGSGPQAAVVRSNLQGPPLLFEDPLARRTDAFSFHDGDGSTYRTVCVRLCDGYFFPISFSTTEKNFKRDRQQCESQCGSPARLYVYKNPGEEPQDMRDLDGQPYSKLKTAYLYRTKYEAACKCKPNPWEQEALDKHRLYALEAAGAKGDKVAAKGAAELRAKIAATAAEKRNEGGRKIGTLNSLTPVNSFSATIVAADPASVTDDTTEVETKPEPDNKKSAKASRSSGRNDRGSRQPDIMRLGASGTSAGRSGGGSGGRSGGNWSNHAFRGN